MTAPALPAARPWSGEGTRALPATYLAVWPVVDPSRTSSQLVAEAGPALLGMLEQSGVRPLGPVDWHVTADALLPGAVDGLVLVARVPVAHVGPDAPALVQPPAETAARRDRADRRAAVARLSARGLGAAEIADQLGCSERQVVRDRALLAASA